MTKLAERRRRIVVETACVVRGRPLVAEITQDGVELREKSCRTTYLIPWTVCYWVGAKLAAERRRKSGSRESGVGSRKP